MGHRGSRLSPEFSLRCVALRMASDKIHEPLWTRVIVNPVVLVYIVVKNAAPLALEILAPKVDNYLVRYGN